jgi:hypothetical protein
MPRLLGYNQLDENRAQSIPTTVANPPITRSTGWAFGIPLHRDSLIVRREQRAMDTTRPRSMGNNDEPSAIAAEDQKLLDILAEVIAEATTWADKAERTPHPFHEKIRKANGQDKLYKAHLPFIRRIPLHPIRQGQSKPLDMATTQTTPRRV